MIKKAGRIAFKAYCRMEYKEMSLPLLLQFRGVITEREKDIDGELYTLDKIRLEVVNELIDEKMKLGLNDDEGGEFGDGFIKYD